MEPINLRGHHIHNLRGYKFDPSAFCDIHITRNYEHQLKVIEIYNKILEGTISIIIIDSHDDICYSCPCKCEGGCLHEDGFEPAEDAAQADRSVAERFGIEIGKTYEGMEFLKIVNIGI
jgi:hypothetical protein